MNWPGIIGLALVLPMSFMLFVSALHFFLVLPIKFLTSKDWLSLAIWTAVVSFGLGCVLIIYSMIL